MTVWVVGAAALVIGAAGGALADHVRHKGSESAAPARQQKTPEPPPVGLQEIRPSDAAQDWAQAERGRPWSRPAREPAHPAAGMAPSAGQGASADGIAPQPGVVGFRAATERAAADQAVAERTRLVEACADLADRLRDHQPAVYAVLRKDLEGVGVTVQLADGEVFDAGRHNPVGTEPTSDPSRDLSVAATMRLGYRDHGVVVRQPDVIVYKFGASARAG
jgi:hypothetical protein